MLRRLTIFFGVFGAIVAACGGPTTLDITKYDRSCKAASDCAAVTTDACCGCATSAINKSALPQYEADLAAANKNCATCVEKPCAAVLPQCIAGICSTSYAPDAGQPDAGQPDAGSDASAEASVDSGSDSSSDAGGDAQDASAD